MNPDAFSFHLRPPGDDGTPLAAGPLAGLRVLITRPVLPAARTAQRLAALGAQPLVFPTLIIEPAADPAPLRQALARIDDYYAAIFVSPSAVEMALAPYASKTSALPAALLVFAPGPGTAEELARLGVSPVHIPESRFDSEGLLALPALQSGQVAGKRIVIFRGEDGRDVLPAVLQQRGAEVDLVTAYRRRAPATPPDGLLELLRQRRVDVVSAMNGQALENLHALVGADERDALLLGLPVYASHERIAETAQKLGFRNISVTLAGDAGLITALLATASQG